MVTAGLDLSINSTGICINDNNNFSYYIVSTGCTKAFHNACKNSIIEIIDIEKIKSEKDADYHIKEEIKTINIIAVVNAIMSVIDKYHIDMAYIEGLSYGSSRTTALSDLSGLNFLVRKELYDRGIPFTIVSPAANKKFAVGRGNADKDMMVAGWRVMDNRVAEFEKANSGIKIKIDDLADAFFLSNTNSQQKTANILLR